MVGLIAQLQDIEDSMRLLSPDERMSARHGRSVPVLDRLEAILGEQKGSRLPKRR